jgi:hypothetical protein
MIGRWAEHEEPSEEEALEEELGGEWELDPNDPAHPDYDLSEAAGYSWDPPSRPFYLTNGFIALVSIIIVIAITLPLVLIFAY